MKNIYKIITIILIAGGFLGGYFISKYSTTKLLNLNEDKKIEQQLRENFMQGCTEDGNYKYCVCVYEDLFKTLGKKGFIEMSLKYESDEIIPTSVETSVYKCLDKLE